MLKQTVIADLERALDSANIPYRDNSQAGTITVGYVTFVYLAMQDPDDIYAFNFHGAICDEIDEVPADRVKKIVTAIQERCRAILPRSSNGMMPEREPFIAFTTTAQGLGGMYMLTEEFKKKNIPHAIIRGRTQDNTHLAPSQIQLLRQLYTEDEARAYLDGEFVNLAQGRVYYEFDARKHVYQPFIIRPTDTVYVGQDFNFMLNASVETIYRDGRIYIVNAHYWKSMDEAARGLRQLYPDNPITLIPDNSGKEIMQGFVQAFEEAAIEILWNGRNPSITERILATNKLFRTNRLYMFIPPDEKQSRMSHLKLCLETQDFDDMGKPRKGKGEEALDHVGDSMSYAIWHIIHTVTGFDDIIEVIRSIGSNNRAITYCKDGDTWS